MSLFKKLFPNIKQKNNSSIIVDNGKNNRLILFDADGKETASQYLTNLKFIFTEIITLSNYITHCVLTG